MTAITVTNDDLREHIGRFIGAGDTSWDAQTTRDIERILGEGKRKAYDPEILPPDTEKHRWSFLSPVVNYPFVSGVYEYDMPTGFAMLAGPVMYQPGEDSVYPPIENVGWERVQHKLQQNDSSGRPLICGLKVGVVDTNMPTRWKMVVYPTPDSDYLVSLPMKLNPTEMGDDDNLPLGDFAHVDLLIESCLAAAERFLDTPGFHHVEFEKRLRSSVSHDRQLIAPEVLGYNGDWSERRDAYSAQWRRTYSGGLVTLNGVEV